MKHRLLHGVIVAALGAAAIPDGASAGPNQDANIEFHLMPAIVRNGCDLEGTIPGCATINSHGAVGTYYFLHVLVTEGDPVAGVGAVQFGISYGSGMLDGEGIDIWSWTLCAWLEFLQPTPVWPNSGGGNLIVWDSTNDCQRFEPEGAGVVANAGYFYMGAYSPSIINIIKRPVDGDAKVSSCAGHEDELLSLDLGVAGFDSPSCAYNPMCEKETDTCGPYPTPTINKTWSGVKSLHN